MTSSSTTPSPTRSSTTSSPTSWPYGTAWRWCRGGLTSSSREVIRPILRRLETLYVYNTNYEGGVCDRNFFATGATPGIYVDLLLRAAAERWGKRVYVLAADYNYGQISAQWIRQAALALGGEVVGEEFFPLDVNQFGATISRIQAEEPDVVLNVFVGPAHEAFYGQWASAGMNQRIPMMSTTFGGTSEIVRMPPEVVNGIMVIGSYYESLDYPFNQLGWPSSAGGTAPTTAT